jgi:LPS export ABC transporter protein LptC
MKYRCALFFAPLHAAALIALSAVTSACSNGAPSQQTPLPGAQPSSAFGGGPVYHISARGSKEHPVTISNIVRGVPEYTLKAASVVYATNLQLGRFTDNTMYFYKGRKRRLTVTAPTAVVNEITHDVALSGGVLARTAAGDTLASDNMTYNEKTRLLTAVGHVVASEPGGNALTGQRAIADLDLQQIQLFGQSAVGEASSPAAQPSLSPSP